MQGQKAKKEMCKTAALYMGAGILIILAFLSLFMGRYPVAPADFFRSIISAVTRRDMGLAPQISAVILNIRLPRVIAAVVVGTALASAGAAYQGVFRNPMVSPDVLGASAGASCGAAIAILCSLPMEGVQILSFLGGLTAVGLSCAITRIIGQRESVTLVLVLAGMVISALFSAMVSITKYLADPYSKLPEITFWLMGSLASVTADMLVSVLLPAAAALTALLLLRWRLNVLAFGDEEAAALGMETGKYRFAVILCATLLTASVVSISGQIGWVGLVIPHFGRMLIGPNYRWLLPASALLGGSYLLLMDDIARNLLRVELPLGILTAIVGAPIFIVLLLRGQRGWR